MKDVGTMQKTISSLLSSLLSSLSHGQGLVFCFIELTELEEVSLERVKNNFWLILGSTTWGTSQECGIGFVWSPSCWTRRRSTKFVAAAKVSSFEFVDFLKKRFSLSLASQCIELDQVSFKSKVLFILLVNSGSKEDDCCDRSWYFP